jgi:hypothetical protein
VSIFSKIWKSWKLLIKHGPVFILPLWIQCHEVSLRILLKWLWYVFVELLLDTITLFRHSPFLMYMDKFTSSKLLGISRMAVSALSLYRVSSVDSIEVPFEFHLQHYFSSFPLFMFLYYCWPTFSFDYPFL